MAGEGVLATLRAGWDALGAVDVAKAVQRAVSWPLAGPGGDVRVVRPDDLVVIKLQAGRIIDRADAAMVLRENRDEIDFKRLHGEIGHQGLAAEYREIWREAFPTEPTLDID